MEKNYKTKKEEMKNEKTAGNAVVFENPEFGKILTQTDENGEPLFCAKDVCNALGYKKPRNAVNQLVNPLDALKQGAWVATGIKKDGSEAKRWCQMLFVNESRARVMRRRFGMLKRFSELHSRRRRIC